ncbi:MAG: response regulator, partial [bacterium]|nr:response regulator [bacterium]
ETSTIAGIVMLDDGPAMITSYPVLTSAGAGPTRGALIMVRFLDDAIVERLSETTGYEVTVTSLEDVADQGLLDDLSTVGLSVEPQPGDLISAFCYLEDISGEPVLLLAVTRELDFAGGDVGALRFSAVASIIGAVVLGVVLTGVLDRIVLRRLVGLKNSVTGFIHRGGPHGERFPVSGRDEISELGTSLNDMLDVLERTEAELREATGDLGARKEELAVVNTRLRTELEERKLLEGRLEVAEKLEALGVLAGGIAHDFNNLLVGIMANASLLSTRFEPGSPEHEQVERLSYAAQKATGLTGQLLTFAQGGAPLRRATSVVEIVTQACSFVLGETKATWSFEADPDVEPVNVDRGQVSQVLHNLLINAEQAMPDGGVIEVTARRVIGTERDTVHGLRPGDYVLLSVTDTGPGIPREDIDRIFDPYFSTKAEGSGLGLATAWSIAQRHGGALAVGSSSPGHTTMDLYLPVAEGSGIPSPPSRRPVERHVARVLIVDDSELIVESVESLLKALGYRSASAMDGQRALQMYQDASEALDPFDAVILDLTMPGGMDGAETVAALFALDPDVVAVVSSGYSNSSVLSDFKSHGFKAVLPKPFSVSQLAETLDDVLRPPGEDGEERADRQSPVHRRTVFDDDAQQNTGAI